MSLALDIVLLGFTLLACATGAALAIGGACGLALDDPTERPIAALIGGFGIIIFVMGVACFFRVIA